MKTCNSALHPTQTITFPDEEGCPLCELVPFFQWLIPTLTSVTEVGNLAGETLSIIQRSMERVKKEKES